MQADDNDIVYTQYAPDFLGFFERVLTTVTGGSVDPEGMMVTLTTFWNIYSVIAFILSALFIFGIVYAYIRIGQLSEIEAAALAQAEKDWRLSHGTQQENRRWIEIQKHVGSGAPNDWKLAIIEADIILGEVLRAAGYAGSSIGEQLKSAGNANFTTVQDAWDAHLIRNKIAHEGADFVLTQGMAKEAIVKYERVFREFSAI